MADPIRLSQLARAAGAYERDRLPIVETPPLDFPAISVADQQDARERLTFQRKGSVYYQDPNKQKRNLFRSKKEKAALNDTSSWSFTKAERFAELDRQIRQQGTVTLAQAILNADASDPFDVNGVYVSNGEGTALSKGGSNGWLDLVAERNDVKYVRLLVAYGASQQSKDLALGKALKKGAIDAVQELLRSNANPNVAGVEHFMNAVTTQDTRLINIFLTAIVPLHPQCINEALIATICRDTTDLVALLFAHGASGDYGDGHALSTAITEEHIEDAATILLHSNGTLSLATLTKATEAACQIHTQPNKLLLLEMLLCAGANPNSSTLQDELLKAVNDNQLALVELLVSSGTSPDRNDAESLRLAIVSGRAPLVTILLQGSVSHQSASRALDEANALEENEQYEFVVTSLVENGVSADSLHSCLADAVDRGCGPSLAPMLIVQGANVEYAGAQGVRAAIRQSNFSLLHILLRGTCRSSILSKALPDAMRIQPQSERFHVMSSLMEKGVSGKGVHVSLRMLVSEEKNSIDYRLMDLLVRKNASVDYFDKGENCICIAASQENEKALDTLTAGNPSADTVSAALGLLPVSLAKSEAAGYERTVRMIRLLLEKGAHGLPVSEMLIEAVRDDYRGKALDLLLNHHADANYHNGKAVEEALRLHKSNVLEQLCRRSKLDKKTFTSQLPNVLESEGFSLEKVNLLASTSSSYGYEGVLDAPLLKEIQIHGSRKDVLELFLGLGASVNFQNGEPLRHAVSQGDVETVRLLLPAKPTTMSVARAFPATMHIKHLPTRYALMQHLLHSGKPGMGDEALIQASREANSEDLSHVMLLLQHKASPNYREGAPVLESITARNLPLLDVFVKSQLNKKTLTNAFNLAREMEVSREVRYQIFASLFKSGHSGFETSQALIEVVQRLPTDDETSVLLLDHGASVDLEKGRAMQIAASAGALRLLDIFISKGPHRESCDAAFLAANRAQLDIGNRKDVYRSLLQTGVSRNLISRALYQATHHHSVDKSLLRLLISFGASLDAEEGGAIYNVTARGDLDTLKTLLTGSISKKETLDKALTVCMCLEGELRWKIAKELFEKKPGVSVEVISSFLALLVQENDHSLLSLAMGYSPDPSYNNGESFVLAAQKGDDASLAILAGTKITQETLNRAFESMLDSRTIQSTSRGLEAAGILIRLGVEQSLLDRTLLDGFEDPVDQKTRDLVDLLIPFKPDLNGDAGKAFIMAARSNEVELFKLMASQGPSLNVTIPSLIKEAENWTVEGEELAIGNEENVRNKIEKSVNKDRTVAGPQLRVLQMGVEAEKEESKIDAQREEAQGDDAEPPKLVDGEPQAKEKSLNPKGTPEQRLVFYLQILEECGERDDHPLGDSLIFTAMMGFPNGKLLVKHLLDFGCPANSHIDADLDPSGELFRCDPAGVVETMTAVIWALSSEEPKIGEDVVLEILEKGQDAEISFETPLTRHSAAHIASADGQCTILKRLIEIGIVASQRNSKQFTASFYASRKGHKEAVEILHAAGSKADDGSLHEAAREAHPEIVDFLIASGHRVDFPSSLHADGLVGRTALEELCLHSLPGKDIGEWKERIPRCMEQLLPNGILDVHKSHGKTMLHLALENSVAVTQILLDFPTVWENINHPIHLFRDDQGYFYSPTKYVEFFCTDASAETKQALVSLLSAKKCEDKYYSPTVKQPEGAVGLPEAIALAVDKQRRADFEHDEALKRLADLARRNRAIEAEDLKRRLAVDKERHDILMRQHREQEESEKKIAQRKQALALSHAQELQSEREDALRAETRLKQAALSEEASQRRAIQDSEMSHRRNMAMEESSAMEAKMAMEQRIINERERASKREASLIMDVLSRREATAKYEAQQRSYNNGY